MESYPYLVDNALLKTIFDNPLEAEHRLAIWKKLFYQNEPDTWDYRWSYACFVNGALAALPNVNLVANVGFGTDATHTISGQSLAPKCSSLLPLTHPRFILRDSEADSYTYFNVYGGGTGQPSSKLALLKKGIRSVVRRIKAEANRYSSNRHS
jgi:hypothetical protein